MHQSPTYVDVYGKWLKIAMFLLFVRVLNFFLPMVKYYYHVNVAMVIASAKHVYWSKIY